MHHLSEIESSPMESQMPIACGARKAHHERARTLLLESDETGISESKRKIERSPKSDNINYQREELHISFDDESDPSEEKNEFSGEEDESEYDNYTHGHTPFAIRMVRKRLQRKPRKAPKKRGSPKPDLNDHANHESSSSPIQPKLTKHNSKVITRRKVEFPKKVMDQYLDYEAQLSESDFDDSGDEIIDGNIDVDLEDFVVGDDFEESSPNQSQITPGHKSLKSPGMTMYYRSLKSPLSSTSGIGFIMKHRAKMRAMANTSRVRDEWEGCATQVGEGAEAIEYYDDEDLADFVVDDENEEYEDIDHSHSRDDDDDDDVIFDGECKHIPDELNRNIDSLRLEGGGMDGHEKTFNDKRKRIDNIGKGRTKKASMHVESSDHDDDFVQVHKKVRKVEVMNNNQVQKSVVFMPPEQIAVTPVQNKKSNQTAGSDFSLHEPTPNRSVFSLLDSSEPCRPQLETMSQVQQDKLCVLVDNREIRSGISSILKSKFGMKVEFRQLGI